MSINCDVYLVHYESLIDRLVFMKDQFHRLGIVVKEIISSEPPHGWIKDDLSKRINKLSYFSNNSTKSVTRSEESLAWKHLLFLEKVAKGTIPCLLLEDDAILNENFVDEVNKILRINDWDIIFPGSGCNLRKPGNGLIRVSHPASKCTDSYIITPDAAKKLYSTMSSEINLAIDWELNYQMMIHDLNVFWLEPPIVRQGSQDGTWISSINFK